MNKLASSSPLSFNEKLQ
ncbi:unnamed protein product, partial [Adineta steineri]